MTLKYAKGVYAVKNPEKYVGSNQPVYRSGWEHTFMLFCDNNPAIQEWASEPVKIPYRDPLTGRQTVYVPDFLIKYIDRNQRAHVEIVEIKPAKQQILEKVGKNAYDQAQFVKNMAKWESAQAWCKQRGIRFRIINENDIFHNPGKKR
jgi:hypothetical protein